MRLRETATLLLGAVLLTACGAQISAPADLTRSAEIVSNEQGEAIFLILAGNCYDELAGSGTLKVRQMSTTPSSGGLNAWIDTDLKGEVSSAITGNRYTFSSSERFSVHISNNDAVSISSRFKLIGKGGVADVRGSLNYKVAFNPNGELTVERNAFRGVCE